MPCHRARACPKAAVSPSSSSANQLGPDPLGSFSRDGPIWTATAGPLVLLPGKNSTPCNGSQSATPDGPHSNNHAAHRNREYQEQWRDCEQKIAKLYVIARTQAQVQETEA